DPGVGVPYCRVSDARWTLAHLAAAWHGYPARQLIMIGVTGTDGKTTTSNLIHSILQAAGLRAGLISTVNAVIGDKVLDTGFHVTTPEALDVQSYLAQMVRAGLTHCVLEATSHGLAQHRVAACDFDLGVVTNITHEHLDYHGTFEAYQAAKGRLFSGLSRKPSKSIAVQRTAILNRDDDSYAYLATLARVRQVSYSLSSPAEVRAQTLVDGPRGLDLEVVGPGYSRRVTSRLRGAFNAANILAAFAATVEGLGIAPETAADGITAVRAIPGRMEPIDLGQPFTALVDFAHTPNALQRALQAARGMTTGRVIAVFGSAGLRDREKRRLMAEVAARTADLTILTAEDPRTESLEAILSEMAAGASAAGGEEGRTFWRVPDRGDAILFAVSQARPGDLVIACGKGHEQSMCFGETENPWDDRVAMRAALSDLLGVQGPAMPHLPTRA
ncbi:MAG: UDP-N-acetylmuramoyl-L-alanyl-D-glutamate--2,6-diaminopimelate ligase, partial [Chloroflexi bacterium]|nr:UDP-N-acetylmuramoyl-L-alanyl-D-glutamate--2,6-diaminopimelate ligase [Chloroflexota bacterium]